eukprot:scaffold34035_cov60-Phaeocystis_antarctica.AAC.1
MDDEPQWLREAAAAVTPPPSPLRPPPLPTGPEAAAEAAAEAALPPGLRHGLRQLVRMLPGAAAAERVGTASIACRAVGDDTMLVETRPSTAPGTTSGTASGTASAAAFGVAAGAASSAVAGMTAGAAAASASDGAARDTPPRAELVELLQAALCGAQRAQALYRGRTDEVRRLRSSVKHKAEAEARAAGDVTTTGIRLNDRLLFVRSAAVPGRGARPYLAVRSDGGPPAFLSKDSEETLMAAYPAPSLSLSGRPSTGGGAPDLALGKVIHISDAQSELCAAYGLPAGSTYSVVTAEMLELQDPRSALLSHT